jgi:site-specific recombinase XerD
MKPIAHTTAIDRLVDEYRHYLIHTAGLRLSTCKRWTYCARLFLRRHFKPNTQVLDLSQLTVQTLLCYFLEPSFASSQARLQSMASGLRSFCRFLVLSARTTTDLSVGIPRVASGGRTEWPTYLSRQELAQLFDGLDSTTAIGRRDQAMIFCLGKLALRAGEVAGLCLEDIDWRAGTLRLAQTKGRRERQLPLPAAVGRVLAQYLRWGRPQTPIRSLFVSHPAGKPLSAESVSRVASQSLKKAGLAGKGAHLLRRTVASHLVQQGVSLKAVADLLGHRSLDTTRVYAQVNLPMLREVMQPWPKEVAR